MTYDLKIKDYDIVDLEKGQRVREYKRGNRIIAYIYRHGDHEHYEYQYRISGNNGFASEAKTFDDAVKKALWFVESDDEFRETFGEPHAKKYAKAGSMNLEGAVEVILKPEGMGQSTFTKVLEGTHKGEWIQKFRGKVYHSGKDNEDFLRLLTEAMKPLFDKGTPFTVKVTDKKTYQIYTEKDFGTLRGRKITVRKTRKSVNKKQSIVKSLENAYKRML